jgi:hypothetical protein
MRARRPDADGPATERTRERLATLGRLLTRPVRFVAFWLAVVLPLAYLPLFVVNALTGATFLACVAANVLALVFGHPYGDGTDGSTR